MSSEDNDYRSVESENPENRYPPLSPEGKERVLNDLRSHLEELQRRGQLPDGVILTPPKKPRVSSVRPKKEGSIARMDDGSLIWLIPGPSPVMVLSGNSWVAAGEGGTKPLTFGAVIEAKPLTALEIADLISKGILPKE